MLAVYLFVQLMLLAVCYVLLYVFEAIHWARVQVRVRSEEWSNHFHDRNNHFH